MSDEKLRELVLDICDKWGITAEAFYGVRDELAALLAQQPVPEGEDYREARCNAFDQFWKVNGHKENVLDLDGWKLLARLAFYKGATWAASPAEASPDFGYPGQNGFVPVPQPGRLSIDEAAITNTCYRIWNDLAEFLSFIGPHDNKYKAIAAIQGEIVRMLNDDGGHNAAALATGEQR